MRLLKFLPSLCLALLISNQVMGQGFLKKQSGASKSATDKVEDSSGGPEMSVDDMLKMDFRVVKVVYTDESGVEQKNEDGTLAYRYYVINQDGGICSAETAKKLLSAANKSRLNLLAKVGTGAVAGGLLSAAKSGGNVKEAAIGAAVGAAAGVISSSGDIKKLNQCTSKYKEYKVLLSDYEKTFTEEGDLKDASADLSMFEGCETLSKSAQDVKKELEASRVTGENLSIEDADFDGI
ncbi:MAG: hypothetical protein ACRCY5_06030 [Phocaeicola sp.]